MCFSTISTTGTPRPAPSRSYIGYAKTIPRCWQLLRTRSSPRSFVCRAKLLEHLELFDGIDYSHFYTKNMNFNKKAVDLARRAGRPLVGTSDSHFLWQMGATLSFIETKEKSLPAILDALRQGQVEVHTDPLPVADVLLRLRKYPSLKVRRLARRNGYRSGGEILALR